MAIEEIPKAPTSTGYRDQIVRLVCDRKDHSDRQFINIRRKLPLLYDMYRGISSGRYQPHKNDIHIPLIFSTIQSDVARKTQTSFGSWPIVSFLGNAPEDAVIARKREALISSQMKDCGSFRKGYDLFLTADLYGTAVLQWGWKYTEENTVITHQDMLPISGKPMSFDEKRTVTTFDGPDWRVLDLLDCYPQPGARQIEDMDWFITREFLDIDRVKELA
jgi:hypothetical protein